MPDFKLNGVTFASESGGVVSLSDANIFPKGHIIQTVTASSTQTVSAGTLTSNQWIDTGLSVEITPKYNNSKIYLHHTVAIIVNDARYHGLRIQRTSPVLGTINAHYGYDDYGIWTTGLSAYTGFDMPNTLSLCNYKVQAYRQQGSMHWNYNGTGAGYIANLIAMEIKEE